eukprot:m.712462 g.712462  ORF g.712462 m.712462 type:complete len:140 (-) comp58775_c1_seq34:225-644(-)
MIAARSQNTECLQRLLEAGANVALRDRERWTVLHCVLRPLNLRALEILLKAPGVSDIINVPNSVENPLRMHLVSVNFITHRCALSDLPIAAGWRDTTLDGHRRTIFCCFAASSLAWCGYSPEDSECSDRARACSEMWKC